LSFVIALKREIADKFTFLLSLKLNLKKYSIDIYQSPNTKSGATRLDYAWGRSCEVHPLEKAEDYF
jgi:hypothetical protein